MPADDLSRRALLRLQFARHPARPAPEPVKAAISERWERGADALLRAWEPLAGVLCDVAGVADGMRVLDAASGDGNVALEAARRGAAVSACDISPAQVDRASERALASELTVLFRVADVEALPEWDESYDAAISGFGAALAPRPRHAVRELLRVLRSGGWLVLAAPAPGSLTAAAIALAQGGPGALPDGFPSPTDWGRDEIAEQRVRSVAPDVDVETRVHPLTLAFASEAAAWAAYAGPFGLPDSARDAFADRVAALSESTASVRIAEPVTLVLARR